MITAPLAVAHSQFPLAGAVTMAPIVIDEIVVGGDVATVNVLDVVDPGPAIPKRNGLGTTSCARATSGLLKQTTAANAKSSGRRLSVGKCFSPK